MNTGILKHAPRWAPAVLACLLLMAISAACCAQVTELYTFAGTEGAYPAVALLQANDGNLYSTTRAGGASGAGTIFKVDLAGNFKLFYSFTGGADGGKPNAGLVQAGDGNLYGTSAFNTFTDGTIFKIDLAGNFTLLYTFPDPYPFPSDLIQATDGNLYGVTLDGGAYNSGAVFRITPSGNFTTLYSFSATSTGTGTGTNTDGAYPAVALVQASDGKLYGSCLSGGANAHGTIFKVDLAGNFTLLHTFTGTDGANPSAALLQARDGNLYGTCNSGGANNSGTIFKLTTADTFTPLYSFTGFAGGDGANPYAALIQATDGNLYGTCFYGGAHNSGTVFGITTSGNYTTLYSFSALSTTSPYTNTEGGSPFAALLQASDGKLYGTCFYGGAHGYGTVFKFSGAYPQPGLLSLSPSSLDAGSPAFTLTVKGASFQPFSTVNWNGSPLTTTYVSATALKAAVPARLLAAAGKAAVTVVTGAGGGTSDQKTFTILLTTLKLTAANLTRNSAGSYSAKLTIKNTGYRTASHMTITKATLGAAATSTTLPLNLGSISAGSSGNGSLSFPASAGSSGTVVTLKVLGTFTRGTFSGSLKVTLH